MKNGLWKYHKRNETISFDTNNYEIDLERLSIYNWIDHLQNKAWMTNDHIIALLYLLKEIKLEKPNLPIFVNPPESYLSKNYKFIDFVNSCMQ